MHPNSLLRGQWKTPDGQFKKRYRTCRIGGRKRMSYHRHVVEKHRGRKLLRSEHVHHKDHNPLNNDISNLEVMSQGDHARLHNETLPKQKPCAWCGKVFTPERSARAKAKSCSEDCAKHLRFDHRRKVTPEHVTKVYDLMLNGGLTVHQACMQVGLPWQTYYYGRDKFIKAGILSRDAFRVMTFRNRRKV